jgi:DNA-directed RNA polymerase subunit RPC12/RpoP
VDPFSITCTTCKSRLKVRDESAIGQILACPKCGGLVMVKRPAEGEAPASDSAETRPDLSTLKPRPAPLPLRPGDTLPAGAFDEIDSILSDAPPRPRDPLPGGSKKARVSINDAAGQSAITLSSQAAKKQSPNRPAETARSGDVKDAAATAPSASSSSILSSGPVAGGSSLIAGSGKSGSKVKAGLSGVKGPAAAAAAVTQAVGIDPHPQAAANPLPAAVPSATPADGPAPYPFSSEQDPVPPTPAPKHVWWHLPLLVGSIAAGILLAVGVVLIAVTVLRDDSSLLASNPVKSQPVSAEPLTDPSSPSGDQSAGSDEDIQAPAADSSTEPASTTDEQPANDSPATQEAPPANATVADAGPGGDKTAKSPPPAPPGDNDPLGIVPAPRDGNRPAADTALADPLGKFGNLIESPAADPIPLEQTGASPAIDIPADTADASASRPPLPRPEPRDVDVTARLADQFPAIDVSGVPLVDFLQFAQDFSTVPITLEPDALGRP